ncbi:hypothetical protein PVAND_008621 [Polypedilum vanderplanki]|uniref:DUF4200 domain-containing protein n=1 Tax=Polypedilum vanderplanki TaxID=319348 RepID=A0A9J6CA58_POLVA|nr:hypothetical protein PVAND_008621 [Polypedilum vanderplanki]
MPRTKPTLKLGVYGSFDINPEQAVTSFFESKQQDELYFKKPLWDVPREGLQHEAIENEREFLEMSSQQEIFKRKAAIQKKINERRIEDMHHTQEKLREKFIDTNSFLKECSNKLERTDGEIAKELAKQKIYKEEIEVFEKDKKKLAAFELKFKEVVKDFEIYVDVFSEVIENSDYESFDDLTMNIDSLLSTQIEISEREQQLVKGIEHVRQTMIDSTAKAAQRIIELNDELAELESHYNQARTETLKWENTLATAKDFIAENEKQTITLVDSIQHLYHLLTTRNDEKVKLKKFDVGGQLDYIRDEIEILEDIIKRAHHKMEKEGQSMLGEGSNRFQNNVDKGSDLSD